VITQDSYFYTSEDHSETYAKLVKGYSGESSRGVDLSERVLIELSTTKQLIERRVYTMWDWVGEIGGIHGFMQLFISLFLPLF
jgi:hypothetical protein